MKQCPKCRTLRDDQEFYQKPYRKDGLSGWCRGCENAASRHARHKREVKFHLESWAARKISNIRSRCRTKGIKCDIDAEYLLSLWTGVCPALGIKLCLDHTKVSPDSPSIDRIKPHLGYVKGNVAIISYRANAIKQNATSSEICAVYRWLIEKEEEFES